MRAREPALRPLRRAGHLEHAGANAIAGVVALAQDLLAFRQDRLGLSDLEDHVALLDAVHDAAQDLALLAGKLRVDPLSLGVPHLLEDDLLGGLGRDPPEVLGRTLLLELELVVELRVGVQRLGVGETDLLLVVGDVGHDLLAAVHAEVAALPVDVHTPVVGGAERLARRREQGRLQRLEEDLLVDPLLATDLLDDSDQLSVHRLLHSLRFYALRGQGTSASSRAFVTAARPTSVRSPPCCSSTRRSGVTSASRPRISAPPASQQCTCLPTAHRYSRSLFSCRSRPGDDTSRS